MALVTNYNEMAANAAHNLTNSYGQLSVSTRRLSSGLRVGTAADDAAGMAIRELMRADIAATNQGVRNANDAISLTQTADGALQTIDEKLTRMKELAEQASTGTYNSTQRAIIDSEYQSMASEITRIASATDFNGINLLDGSLSSSSSQLTIQFGTGNNSSTTATTDRYSITIGLATASALGLGVGAGSSAGGYSVSTQAAAQSALTAISTAITSKDNIRANLGALQNRLSATVSNLQTKTENLQSSESRISDVDVATEMTQFTRNQILTQSAVAMLSQANSLPKMAMQLIQG